MSKTASEYLVEALEKAGVKRVYGVVGDSLNGFTDSMRRRKSIDWIHMRHEEASAFAAGAEAHLTGSLAVCAGSCGPGNLHLITGCSIANATAFLCWRSLPTSQAAKSALTTSRPRIRKACSRTAVITSSWSPILASFRKFSSAPCASPSRSEV